VESITELEPLRFPEVKEEKPEENEEPVIEDPDYGKSETDIIDEINGQMKLF
jgi:topoisomerase-4 subunit A